MFSLFSMKSLIWKSLKHTYYIFPFMLSCLAILLAWCWWSWEWEALKINVSDFTLKYDWNIELKKVYLKDDDLDEIVDLYEEVWEDLKYRDSLLIAEKYSQWLWINAFVQDNLDVLESYDLTITDIHKTQIPIKKDGKKFDSVLVEYEISEWFIPEIPLLYISQLFIKDWDNVLLFSFTTESQSSRDNMSDSFRKIN